MRIAEEINHKSRWICSKSDSPTVQWKFTRLRCLKYMLKLVIKPLKITRFSPAADFVISSTHRVKHLVAWWFQIGKLITINRYIEELNIEIHLLWGPQWISSGEKVYISFERDGSPERPVDTSGAWTFHSKALSRRKLYIRSQPMYSPPKLYVLFDIDIIGKGDDVKDDMSRSNDDDDLRMQL